MTDTAHLISHDSAAPLLRTSVRDIRVLLMAPDTPHTERLAMQLVADEVDVVTATSAQVAAARLHGDRPAAIIVTAELDSGSGYNAIDALAACGTVADRTPTLALCEQPEPMDRLRAMQRGCIDVVAAPVFYPELLARLRLALARWTPVHDIARVDGSLTVDYTSGLVHLGGSKVQLTPVQFNLLGSMAQDPTRIWRRTDLLRQVWGYPADTRSRTVDSHALRVRRALQEAGGDYVHNVWGVGYRLVRL